MTHRERVRAALAHVQPDATPCDYYATGEIHLMDEVGAGGGYILAPSHQIQPDTPIANVLAVYRAAARRRGGH